MRRSVATVAVVVVGGLLSWPAIVAGFDPLFVVGGSAPATIWGPALGVVGTAVLVAVPIVLAAIVQGRVRLAAIALWVLMLSAATHRIVERADGTIADRWLGIAVRTLPADPADEPEAPRCTVGRWLARCDGGAAGTLWTISPLPMAALLPGRWED